MLVCLLLDPPNEDPQRDEPEQSEEGADVDRQEDYEQNDERDRPQRRPSLRLGHHHMLSRAARLKRPLLPRAGSARQGPPIADVPTDPGEREEETGTKHHREGSTTAMLTKSREDGQRRPRDSHQHREHDS